MEFPNLTIGHKSRVTCSLFHNGKQVPGGLLPSKLTENFDYRHNKLWFTNKRRSWLGQTFRLELNSSSQCLIFVTVKLNDITSDWIQNCSASWQENFRLVEEWGVLEKIHYGMSLASNLFTVDLVNQQEIPSAFLPISSEWLKWQSNRRRNSRTLHNYWLHLKRFAGELIESEKASNLKEIQVESGSFEIDGICNRIAKLWCWHYVP